MTKPNPQLYTFVERKLQFAIQIAVEKNDTPLRNLLTELQDELAVRAHRIAQLEAKLAEADAMLGPSAFASRF